MATTNPLAGTSTSIKPVSSKTFCIAGISTDVFGLDELSPASKSLSCLWLLHPRLQAKEIMASVAASCINDWNQRPSSERNVGLIAVAFDQRNHGGRKVHDLANESWREGNETHAQDMFSIYHGTALDTSLLIDHLGSYIFHGPDYPSITQHMVMGISLGGHSAWQVLFNEPRVTAGIVIIGCPDYINLMTDRARLSKLPSYITTTPPGCSFLGSPSFPSTLLNALSKSDPRSILFPSPTSIPSSSSLSTTERTRLLPLLTHHLSGKSLLICSGGADKLVPYRCSQPFLEFLKGATDKEKGWWREGSCNVDDRVYEGVGHVFSEGMRGDTVAFVREALERGGSSSSSGSGSGSGGQGKDGGRGCKGRGKKEPL
ncbi:hypothetical protein BKA65DRAFT_426173 [Rhexocercosporidium sp. MPI-PUGE-AT-0058]|nr:hypothetical protein BKA65DRAFT_426173 [Rhexocercosporidium sp. MPI-PUGE-AT-0058]